MWIVRLALRRPYTFVVAAMLVFILGLYLIIARMPTDIFPNINIPVISVSFNYGGMSAEDVEKRIVSQFERILTTTVNDIEHIESQSLNGIGVIKVYFQNNANIENATAQVTAIAQTATRSMPPGTQPPLIIQYNASSVPIMQLSLSSDTLPEQAMFDVAVNTLRPKLITVRGVQIPFPYGGKQRQIVVDLDPDKLFAYNVSPSDVSTTLGNQNLILPAGSIKLGTQETQVRVNSSPSTVAEINDLPIKSTNGKTTYIRDVAHVRDGFQVQTNVVHANGKGGVLISILKSGSASTLDVVDGVKKLLPELQNSLPPEMRDALKITPLFDQSVFVRASVTGVMVEAGIAAGLTAIMILMFLGSWRSTLIVIISIPLSILVSIIVLYFIGETLNVMTLGGMALAVGILVDDATVEIENIHRNLHQRKRLVQAILDYASQIAVPAFVATTCICIVFVPVVFISGAAKFLFTPLAMAVVFAMMTSYLLSRTLVPTMVHYLLAAEVEMYGGIVDQSDPHAMHEQHRKEKLAQHAALSPEEEDPADKLRRWIGSTAGKATLLVLAGLIASSIFAFGFSPIADIAPAIHAPLAAIGHGSADRWNLLLIFLLGIGAVVCLVYIIVNHTHYWFNRQFEKLRLFYGGLLAWSLQHRAEVVIAFSVLVIASVLLLGFRVGQDFFPTVDAGQIRMHVRAPAGTRIEQTQTYFADVEEEIRKIIPAKETAVVLDNIGIPNSSINLSLSDGSQISPADGEILISLKEGHAPTADYMKKLRMELSGKFPDLLFYMAPADIVTQVLNFGLQAPIDIQLAGSQRSVAVNEVTARKIATDVAKLPGIVDVRLRQVPRTPDVRVNVDRTLASQLGVTQREVASDLLISLSSSNQTAPNYWLNPQNGVNYSIFVQTPQHRIDSIDDLKKTPIVPSVASAGDNTQLLGNLASTTRGVSPTNVTHYNILPTFDVLLSVENTDLGTAAGRIQDVIDRYTKDLPKDTKITLRGQIESMNSSFLGLAGGMVFAVLLVYLLMVINFQSWLDPLIILMALPGAVAGILWMLWATQSTISVPALMGAIMSIGVATANSILMITFANDQRKDFGMNAHDAALSAGLTRLRPVLMTAAAMIIGMLPMSLGFGEGGEQNAPLGRAVIGGLSMATFATLFFVPVVYSLLRAKAPKTHVEKELQE